MAYSGYLLTHQSRQKLKDLYPPMYSTFLGHHITEQFGIPEDSNIPKQPKEVLVIGYLNDNEGVEGFLVSIDDNVERAAGGKYHITWSIDRDKGKTPVDTNKLVDNPKPLKISNPIKIKVIPQIFTKSTQQLVNEHSFKEFLKEYNA